MARHKLTTAGPGRPKGIPNKATIEIKAFAREIVEDETYRQNLLKRLQRGTCAPAVETMVWDRAYGKVKQTMELEGGLDLSLINDAKSSLARVLDRLAQRIRPTDVAGEPQ